MDAKNGVAKVNKKKAFLTRPKQGFFKNATC